MKSVYGNDLKEEKIVLNPAEGFSVSRRGRDIIQH